LSILTKAKSMPAIGNIVINDAVPAAHTFAVLTTSGSAAQWKDRASASALGFRTLTHEVRPPKSTANAHRVILTVTVPVEETVGGIVQVTRYSSATVTLNLASASTLQERKDLLAYVSNSLANANVKLSVENLEPFY
jgi:hypothetical protein